MPPQAPKGLCLGWDDEEHFVLLTAWCLMSQPGTTLVLLASSTEQKAFDAKSFHITAGAFAPLQTTGM